MNDCLFCKIIAGEIPAEKIYEDEKTFAFLDINPVNPGHTLVIPKEHSKNILDISSESLARVMETVRKLSPAIKTGVSAEGINIHINNEQVAGQVVFHTHVHILPRFSDDGHRLWKGELYKDGAEQVIAKQVTDQL